MRKALVAILLLGGGCEPVAVSVNCATLSQAAVECTVQQVQGTAETEACWDFAIECPNGVVAKAPRMCTKVSGGGTETVSVAADKLTGMDKCSGKGEPKAVMSNLTIDGKEAKL
jgi:hypothetical protein